MSATLRYRLYLTCIDYLNMFGAGRNNQPEEKNKNIHQISTKMSAVNKQEKRKNKKKYFQSKKQKISRDLEAGLKGFIITSNNESQCIKESYDLLNEFAEEMLASDKKTEEESQESGDDDLESQLAKEIQDIKNEKKRFQQISTKVKGVIFIATTIDDPTSLVNSIFETVLRTQKRKTRHISRLQPVIATCKATEDDMRKAMDSCLNEFTGIDGNQTLTYKIDAKIRHNNSLMTAHILSYTGQSFEKYAPSWKVSMLSPDVVISINVFKSICCIGFLKNYALFRKYNLSEVAMLGDRTPSTSENGSEDKNNQAETEENLMSNKN